MESDTDFAMTDEAIRYIKEQVLSDDGKNALWRGGLASTQIGYSPFVSNAEERSWRTLKHLFPKGYQSQGCRLALSCSRGLKTASLICRKL
jgi:hypothetical protein